ncbi:MAG: hypothetical protein GY729_04140, partial [Desulfobacteraceae bacterium]|nr:hypothetical protein [Desulfobacteraceae bacterium]
IFSLFLLEAGWLSKPKNFEECVLEKMKGQDKSMRPFAIKACRKLFPEEKKITADFDLQNIEFIWSAASPSQIELTIKENNSEYRISKCEVFFSLKKCSDIKSFDDYVIKKTFIFKDGEERSSLEIKDAHQYSCMKRLLVWGFLEE